VKKLTYWIADSVADAPCYSIRARTKREVVYMLNRVENAEQYFGKPRKVQIEFENAFDLLLQCTSEGGLNEHREVR